MSDRTPVVFSIEVPHDREAAALLVVITALDALTAEEAARVAEYAVARFSEP